MQVCSTRWYRSGNWTCHCQWASTLPWRQTSSSPCPAHGGTLYAWWGHPGDAMVPWSHSMKMAQILFTIILRLIRGEPWEKKMGMMDSIAVSVFVSETNRMGLQIPSSSNIFVTAPFLRVSFWQGASKEVKGDKGKSLSAAPSKGSPCSPSLSLQLLVYSLLRQPPPSLSFALFSSPTLSNADRLTEDSSGPKICFNFQFLSLILKFSHRNSDLKICCAVKMTSWRGMISQSPVSIQLDLKIWHRYENSMITAGRSELHQYQWQHCTI